MRRLELLAVVAVLTCPTGLAAQAPPPAAAVARVVDSLATAFLAANQAVLVRRDTRAKQPVSLDVLGEELESVLEQIQDDMLSAARERRGGIDLP